MMQKPDRAGRRRRKGAAPLLSLLLVFSFLLSACSIESVEQFESRMQAENQITMLEEETISATDNTAQAAASGAIADAATVPQGEVSSRANTPSADEKPIAGRGEQSAAGPQQAQPASTTKPPAVTEVLPKTVTVTLSVTCTSAVGSSALDPAVTLPANGVILGAVSFRVPAGTTVFELLQTACAKKELPLGYQNSVYGIYVQRIGPIGEKQCGPQSGWTYQVDGVLSPVSADAYQLKQNCKVEWLYVTHDK